MGRFSDIYYGIPKAKPEVVSFDVTNPTKESIKEQLLFSNPIQIFETHDKAETARELKSALSDIGLTYGFDYYEFAPTTLRNFYRTLLASYRPQHTLVLDLSAPLIYDEQFMPIIQEKLSGGRHIHGEHLNFTFDFEKYGVDHETVRKWCYFDGNNEFLFLKSAVEHNIPIYRKDFDSTTLFELEKWMHTVLDEDTEKITGRTMDSINWVDDEKSECARFLDLPCKFDNHSKIILIVPPNHHLKTS